MYTSHLHFTPFRNRGALSFFAMVPTKESVEELMVTKGLVEIAEANQCCLVFPNPSFTGWNPSKNPTLPDSIEVLVQTVTALQEWYHFPGRETCHAYLIGMIGIDKGAEMAHVFAAEHPQYISALLTFGGNISKAALVGSSADIEMSVWMVNAKGDGYKFWHEANKLQDVHESVVGLTAIKTNLENHAKQVRITKLNSKGGDAGIIERFWREMFDGNVRIPGRGVGCVYNVNRIIDEFRPCLHTDDSMLGDNDGMRH